MRNYPRTLPTKLYFVAGRLLCNKIHHSLSKRILPDSCPSVQLALWSVPKDGVSDRNLESLRGSNHAYFDYDPSTLLVHRHCGFWGDPNPIFQCRSWQLPHDQMSCFRTLRSVPWNRLCNHDISYNYHHYKLHPHGGPCSYNNHHQHPSCPDRKSLSTLTFRMLWSPLPRRPRVRPMSVQMNKIATSVYLLPESVVYDDLEIRFISERALF
jgi:hypothetical protein